MNQLDWKKPALIGGLIVGFGSLVPVVSLANVCLCAWGWIGGIIAAKMLIDRSTIPLTYADGARIGLAAGVIGGLIFFVVQAPLMTWQMPTFIEALSKYPSVPTEYIETFSQIQQNMVLRATIALASSLIYGVLLAAFCVIGGALGVLMFEKRRADPYIDAQSR
jgi:hypothetical protein